MSNLSYCRFENTYKDLKDCLEHITDDLSDNTSERNARLRLVELCNKIVLDYQDNLMEFDDESDDE